MKTPCRSSFHHLLVAIVGARRSTPRASASAARRPAAFCKERGTQGCGAEHARAVWPAPPPRGRRHPKGGGSSRGGGFGFSSVGKPALGGNRRGGPHPRRYCASWIRRKKT